MDARGEGTDRPGMRDIRFAIPFGIYQLQSEQTTENLRKQCKGLISELSLYNTALTKPNSRLQDLAFASRDSPEKQIIPSINPIAPTNHYQLDERLNWAPIDRNREFAERHGWYEDFGYIPGRNTYETIDDRMVRYTVPKNIVLPLPKFQAKPRRSYEPGNSLALRDNCCL